MVADEQEQLKARVLFGLWSLVFGLWSLQQSDEHRTTEHQLKLTSTSQSRLTYTITPAA
jgi:hypothetical protein